MAIPTILVNSASGSDTQASGAGPSTALFGTTDASTDATGLIVTLTAGTVLTGVATDGSHVIYLADTTAGARNFGKITGSAGSGGATPTVTVANAFGLSLSGKSWAIGGKRASIGATSSRKLFDNNSAAGDAMPGWIVEMESGHSETLSARLVLRRGGDNTDGPITLQGTSGAATLPILTFSVNGDCLTPNADGIQLINFELQNSNATKTASKAIDPNAETLIRSVKISHSTNKFWKGIVSAVADQGLVIESCEIGHCASTGIELNIAITEVPIELLNNCIHDCGSHGVDIAANVLSHFIVLWNIFESNTGDGLRFIGGTSDVRMVGSTYIGNVFYANTSSGLNIGQTGRVALGATNIRNNIFMSNGAYGINFSGSPTSARLKNYLVQISHNDFYNNTSGKYSPSDAPSVSEQTVDPGFVDAPNRNFQIGPALKELGFPTTTIGNAGLTRSYVDIGAAQRQEVAAGGGLLRHPGMAGGLSA